ncbi:MAG: Rieske 2Fe-2S domain-containing protein [Sandaracinaceae bacterium]|nr:Rieske 2Fe-2S domain-containing protein [Sandaracinaceae bacterium]
MDKKSLPVVDHATHLYEHVPSGWYVLARSKEVPAGAVLTRRLAGQDVVLFRTASGVLSAIAPYCAHMGAHLGHGGCVKGETIECPFHAFRFDTAGKCVGTAYGSPPPPRARQATHPVCERHGEILVWYGNAGEAPWFEVPDLDTTGWVEPAFEVAPLRGHPQETSENSVDMGHLPVVHGYSDIRVLRELRAEPGYLSVQYAMKRPYLPGLPGLGKVYAEFFIHVYGLGYSRVEVSVPELGMRTRHLVFATPVDRERLELHMGFAFEKLGAGHERLPSALRRLPLGLVHRVIRAAGLRAFVHDVKQDFHIWQNKRYVHPPQLAVGDGPVGAYRRWCRQFYPSVNGLPTATADETTQNAAE